MVSLVQKQLRVVRRGSLKDLGDQVTEMGEILHELQIALIGRDTEKARQLMNNLGAAGEGARKAGGRFGNSLSLIFRH